MVLVISFLLLGLFFIYLEFFLPGMIMAIGGGLLILSGGVILYMSHASLGIILGYLAVAIVSIVLVIQLALYHAKQSSGQNQFFLEKDQAGFQACLFEKELIGKSAVAATDLRPAGHILVDETYFPALSKTGYIEKGNVVEIIGGEGAHLLIKIKKEVL